MWAGSWGGVGRVLVSGAVAYVFLVVLLRWSGKRTLSKLNAFDLVVTVAMGSTLGSVVLSGEVPLAEGAAGFVILSVAYATEESASDENTARAVTLLSRS